MNLTDWNKKQIKEALSPDNRWYFGEAHPHIKNPTPNQLIAYYIANRGATNFRKAHESEKPTKEMR